jgi:hypothetical protein
MKRIVHIILTILLVTPVVMVSQPSNKLVRQGNKYYEKEDYKEAEIRYLKSLQSRGDAKKGIYNLGNALYMQNNYLDATAVYDTLRTFRMEDGTRSKAYYNMGNSLLKLAKDSSQVAAEALQSSVESYKQSLRLNPDDMDAKYNLAYAQSLLDQQQQQNQQQDQQDQQQQQDEDQQQQQQQDKEQEQQEDQQQQQQQQQQQEEQQQQEQRQNQPQQISKEDAERMLEALKNDEKETLDKMMQAQVKTMRRVKSEKDW